MRWLLLATLASSLTACTFFDDFSRFHTDAGTAMDGAVIDAPASDLGDTGAPPDLGHPLTFDEFIAGYASESCAFALHCETKIGLGAFVELYCNQALLSYLIVGHTGGAAMLPAGATFDPAGAQRCLDALAARPMDCSVTRAPLPTECDHIVTGTLTPGTPCTAFDQCTSNACISLDSCGGHCAAVATGLPMGSTCTRNNECDPALRCRGGTCQPPGNDTEVCDESIDCADLHWCAASHTCAVLPSSGMACDVSLGGDPCQGLQVCTLAPSGAGRTCQDGRAETAPCDSAHPCQPGLRCGMSTGTCKFLSPPGGMCMGPENCPLDFECIGAVCTPRPVLDQPCNALLPCSVGTCISGTCTSALAGAGCDPTVPAACAGYCDATMHCVPLAPNGTMCMEDGQCMSGSSCHMGTTSRTCTACP